MLNKQFKNLESAKNYATHKETSYIIKKICNQWGKLFMNGIQEQRNDLENYKVLSQMYQLHLNKCNKV